MIDLQILGTFPRPGRWNWSFGTWFYRKLSRSPRDKKIKHLAKYIWRNFFKLAHYFFSFSECNPISDIHLKHTDHCFQFFFQQNLEHYQYYKKAPAAACCLCASEFTLQYYFFNVNIKLELVWVKSIEVPELHCQYAQFSKYTSS